MKADTLRRYQESVNDLAEQLAAAKARIAELERDKARLDWLEQLDPDTDATFCGGAGNKLLALQPEMSILSVVSFRAASVREAIDAAMEVARG